MNAADVIDRQRRADDFPLYEMLEAVARLKGEGITILLVEQNVREALELADRGYVLQTGRTIYNGTGQGLLETDIVKKAFLGL